MRDVHRLTGVPWRFSSPSPLRVIYKGLGGSAVGGLAFRWIPSFNAVTDLEVRDGEGGNWNVSSAQKARTSARRVETTLTVRVPGEEKRCPDVWHPFGWDCPQLDKGTVVPRVPELDYWNWKKETKGPLLLRIGSLVRTLRMIRSIIDY